MTKNKRGCLPDPYSFKRGEMTRILVEGEMIDDITGTFTQEVYVCVEMPDGSKHWEFIEVQS